MNEIKSPYRETAEIEKEIKPTRFQNFIDWWKDGEHYIPFIIIMVVISLFGLMGFYIYTNNRDQALTNKSIKDHGIFVCQQNHYVKTEYPAVGLTKIICLSANGEEKNIYEEINK